MRFAVTLTLARGLHRLSSVHQYDTALEDVARILGSTITLLVAELTKNMDVHYHAIVDSPLCLSDYVFKLKNVTRKHKVFGFSCVKVLEDEPGWVEYSFKDVEETTRLLSRPAILVDDNNYWTGPMMCKAVF